VIILNTTTFDGSTTTITGDKFKGNGYHGGNGLHTVSRKLVGFAGTIKIQGSLSNEPNATDWFDVELVSDDDIFRIDTTGAAIKNNISSVEYNSATTSNVSYNFTGKYLWVRIVIENFSAGTVSGAYMNN